ncbi:MAG: T9SS type A sorting domain-containing protein [Flavobacteriales bacterium]
MKYHLIFIASIILCGRMVAQYDYFNIYWEQTPSNFGSVGTNIFVTDSTYCCIGGTATYWGSYYTSRKVDAQGNELTNIEYPFPRARYVNNPDTYIHLPNGEYWMLESMYYGPLSTAILSHWSEDFEYLYTDTLAYTNEDTVQCQLSSILMIDDTSFVMAGHISYDDNPDEWPPGSDRAEKVLWKMNTNGEFIWKKVLFEEEGTSYIANHIFQLTNGELLISTSEFVNGFKNHELIKTDSEGNVIDTYNWGNPNLSEARCKAVQLSNENLVICYHYTNNYDPDWYTFDLDLHFMEFDPNTMLPVPGSDVNVENDYTNEIIRAFQPEDLLATADGGYLALMNFGDTAEDFDTPKLMKVNSDFELEWMKTYETPIPSYQSYLLDIENTPDGGYIATGEFGKAVTLEQRHWVIKLDACGDVEDNGCPTAVAEFQISDFRFQIAPNPASNMINISSAQEFESITIRDITGRIVYRERMPNHTLNKSLPLGEVGGAGLYLVEVDFDEGRVGAQRLVKE